MLRRRLASRALPALLAAASFGLAACEPHTVTVRFDPEVGDRYRFRSDISTEVERTVDEDVTVDRSTSVLLATESVLAVDDDAVTIAVTLERDGAPSRSYEVRFDRAGRLSTIDLIEGVPVEALGVELAADLPPDVSSPPPGPLEPGQTWVIDRTIEAEGDERPTVVDGTGRIDSLGIEEGHEVAVAIVELSVPVRSVVDTAAGRVTLVGRQTSRSRTTYDLADGAARRDRTRITGDLEVIIEPPAGVQAPPLPGSVRYTVDTETRRVPDA